MRIFIRQCLLGWVCFWVATAGVWAQATPSTEQMVEQLKGPRTRSLRNLTVEAVPTPAAAAPTAASSPSALAPVANAPNPATPSSAVPTPGAADAALAVAASPIPSPNSSPPNTVAQSAAALASEPRPSLSLLIQFDFNSARVKPQSQQALSNLAVALQSADLLASKFAVEGHTDAIGRADLNQRLSQQRADAVRDLLVAQGVNRQRLLTAGKGASELVNRADPAAAENRRVRIVNLD